MARRDESRVSPKLAKNNIFSNSDYRILTGEVRISRSKEWEAARHKENIADRDKLQEENRRHTLSGFEMVKGIDLQAGDIIIHEYGRFQIFECGCGYGAGNEFGDYFWIKGYFVDKNLTRYSSLKDFWAFQRAPIIKYVM